MASGHTLLLCIVPVGPCTGVRPIPTPQDNVVVDAIKFAVPVAESPPTADGSPRSWSVLLTEAGTYPALRRQ